MRGGKQITRKRNETIHHKSKHTLPCFQVKQQRKKFGTLECAENNYW